MYGILICYTVNHTNADQFGASLWSHLQLQQHICVEYLGYVEQELGYAASVLD